MSYYATSKMMFTAAPGSFYPAPKVTSAVVRMEIRPTPAVQVEDEEGYFALVRAAFGQRRKDCRQCHCQRPGGCPRMP